MTEASRDREVERYYRIADISLRTLATILAIIFAYVFASGKLELVGKMFVAVILLCIILGIIFSCLALYLSQAVKWCAIISNLIMILVICSMFVFLMWILLSS